MLPGLVPITLFFLALALTADLAVTELESGVLRGCAQHERDEA